MKKSILAVALGATLLAFAPNIHSDNLIINGGFEDPVVTHPNSWTTYYGQNFTGACQVECYGLVPGWNVWWADDFTPGRLEIQRGAVSGILPFEDNQKAELDSHHRVGNDNNNVVIFQYAEVCEGNKYTLNYAWKSRTLEKEDNNIYVLIDDLIVKNHSLNSLWSYETLNFVASKPDIHAAFVSFGTPNTRGMYLDAISLNGDNPEACGEVVDACEFGKPSGLTLLYNGAEGSNNDQTGDYAIPEFVNFPNPAYIEVYDDNGSKKQSFLGASTVNIGGLFTFEPLKNGKVPPKTTFVIIDPFTGETVQKVHFHTSCSEPLEVADKFGGITVWDFN